MLRLNARKVDADNSDIKHASKQQRQWPFQSDVTEISIDVVFSNYTKSIEKHDINYIPKPLLLLYTFEIYLYYK